MRQRFAIALMALLAGCGGGGGDDKDDATWWRPAADATWHLQLKGELVTDVDADVYDIDLFDTPAETIAQLKADGRRVVCYFSAGSSEDWRPDFGGYAEADLGEPLDDWPGERWLDVRSATVRAVVRGRMDLAVSKGCDGVDPDNVDGYTNDTGFPLSAQDQLDFNTFLADEAHRRGLAVGLKNDVGQLETLAPLFDFAVNEQCHQYDECAGYAAFTGAGKPVLNAEYDEAYVEHRDAICASARALGLHTLVLPLALDGSFRLACP